MRVHGADVTPCANTARTQHSSAATTGICTVDLGPHHEEYREAAEVLAASGARGELADALGG